MGVIPEFAYAMTCEDAVEMLSLSEGTVSKLYQAGLDFTVAEAWNGFTFDERHEITEAASREEAYAAHIVAAMLS